ncbi:MAG: hypothetical protein C1941_00665 [Prosthecochloris sp.]|nr:hypothetical protein [Prosthecochloris sp.]
MAGKFSHEYGLSLPETARQLWVTMEVEESVCFLGNNSPGFGLLNKVKGPAHRSAGLFCRFRRKPRKIIKITVIQTYVYAVLGGTL